MTDPHTHGKDIVETSEVLDVNVLPSFIKFNEYVIYDDTKYSSNDVHMPTFISKEDVIDDIPS